MANLSINEITRESKEYRAELLVDKIFEVGGNSPNFMTDNGLMMATAIVLNGEKYVVSNQFKNKTYTQDLANKILAMKGNARSSTVEIVGTYAGNPRTVQIPLSKIEKSEEFGGQPAGGSKENKGLKFERDLTNRIAELLRGEKVEGPFVNAAKHIIEVSSKNMGSPAVSVEQLGGANQSRPFGYSGGKIVVLPARHQEHGSKLTDVDITHANGQKSHLSLKFGGTLTFVNTGVAGPGKAFPKGEIENGAVKNQMGVALLKALGLSNEAFCNIFNNFGTGKPAVTPNIVDVSSAVDRQQLKALLQTAMGSNYYMVHGKENGSLDFWYMDPAMIDRMSTITGSIEATYAGRNGLAKRLDMRFGNTFFDFKLNIRNKQSGVYPSHFLMDYTSKSGLNKTTLR